MYGLLYHFIQFGRHRDPWRTYRNFSFGRRQKWPWHGENFRQSTAGGRENYAYRFVTENNFGRSTSGAVTIVTFWYLEGARDAWLPNWMKWYSTSFSDLTTYQLSQQPESLNALKVVVVLPRSGPKTADRWDWTEKRPVKTEPPEPW